MAGELLVGKHRFCMLPVVTSTQMTYFIDESGFEGE